MKSSSNMNSAPKPILIWGGGGHGHVVIDLLRETGDWEPAGVIDNAAPAGASIMDVPVLGDESVLPSVREQGVEQVVVAIGQAGARARMLQQARELGFQTPSIVHPSCILAPSARVAPGCVLCAGCIVGARTVVGDGVILNTRTSVDHDNRIGEYSHVAPGAILCGTVTVGHHTWIGAGSVVRDHIAIGNEVMIGAGSLVLNDIPDGQTAYGRPAVCKGKESTT